MRPLPSSRRRHRRLAAIACCVLAAQAAPVLAQTGFRATLEGGQEVPPNASSASGSAVVTLNSTQNALTMTLTLAGVDLDGNQTAATADDVTGLHIHRAAAGANGSVVFGLISPNSDLDGDLVINAAAGTVTSVWDGSEGNGTTLAIELANLLASGLYFNVHTSANPAGEIRGQIVPRFDGLSLEVAEWRPRDSEPFACDASFVGHVYLQKDNSDFVNVSHLLCMCVTEDSGSPVFQWRSLDGSVNCANLVMDPG